VVTHGCARSYPSLICLWKTKLTHYPMLVFVDESGDSGMKKKDGTSELFVISAITFNDNQDAEACDRRISELRQECFRGKNVEFKFNKCCDDFREKFLKAVAAFDFFYLAFGLNKAKLYGPGFNYKEPFYKYTAKLLFENAKPYLRDASVMIDRSGNREFRQQLEKYLKSRINTDREIIRKVKTETSHSNNLLQLADMVCGAVARSLRQDKADRFKFRKIIGIRELNVQVWPKF
jgi:hypothetical protein